MSNEKTRSAPAPAEIPEPKWVKNTRDVAGIASIIGIIAVTVFAFDYLKPWWNETVDDNRRREEEGKSSM